MANFVFNQTATFYSTTRTTDFGKLQTVGASETKLCRYALRDGTFRDQRGEDIENTVGIHLYYDDDINVGSCFVLSDGLTYVVESRTHTANRNGAFTKTYCVLREKEITVSETVGFLQLLSGDYLLQTDETSKLVLTL